MAKKKRIKMKTMVKTTGIFFLLCFCIGCFIGNEKTQYIVIKNGKKLEPYEKVVYKVSADRQEVVYWIEAPGKDRSKLYELKKCRVADLDNWEGEADYILLWKIRIVVVDGKFSPPGEKLINVDWFTWHFKTDPSPSLLSAVVEYGIAILLIMGITGAVMKKYQTVIRKMKKKIVKKVSGLGL
jgi:hypothetical protein